MLRRYLLPAVCLSAGGTLLIVSLFVVFNFVQLARAQTFAQDFVHHAVDDGTAMTLPAVAPAAAVTLSHDRMLAILARAQQIGPLLGTEQIACAVQTDARNLCGGQLMACMVTGTGQRGTFEADIALCRGGDLSSYALAASQWSFDFVAGDPEEQQDRSHI